MTRTKEIQAAKAEQAFLRIQNRFMPRIEMFSLLAAAMGWMAMAVALMYALVFVEWTTMSNLYAVWPALLLGMGGSLFFEIRKECQLVHGASSIMAKNGIDPATGRKRGR